MTLKLLTGNEALALGALHAGVKVVTGYPGTPSTGAIESLLLLDPPGVHVEWSTNEKVAFEIASGAAWAGQRALCTMKMSGVNVAYDSITSIAYSGVVGGLVIYVADDPGVSAGMCEQDTRGFAVMSDLPLLDAASVEDAYRLVKVAFDVSERVGTPVFVRLVTSISSSFAPVDVDDQPTCRTKNGPAQLIRDIDRFTKAGSLICMAQHRDVIRRLEQAGELMREHGAQHAAAAPEAGGVGIVACGRGRRVSRRGIRDGPAPRLRSRRRLGADAQGRPSLPGRRSPGAAGSTATRCWSSRNSSRSSSAGSTSRRRRWAGPGASSARKTGCTSGSANTACARSSPA